MPRYALANKWRNESKIRVHSDGIILSRFHFFFIFSLIDFDIVSFLQSVVTLSWNEKTMDSAFFRLFIPVSFNFLGILFLYLDEMKSFISKFHWWSKWSIPFNSKRSESTGAFRIGRGWAYWRQQMIFRFKLANFSQPCSHFILYRVAKLNFTVMLFTPIEYWLCALECFAGKFVCSSFYSLLFAH